jgi:hypothetical protein
MLIKEWLCNLFEILSWRLHLSWPIYSKGVPSILFLVFLLFWVLWFIYDWHGFIIMTLVYFVIFQLQTLNVNITHIKVCPSIQNHRLKVHFHGCRDLFQFI